MSKKKPTQIEQERDTLREIYKMFGFRYCNEAKKEMDLVALLETISEVIEDKNDNRKELNKIRAALTVLKENAWVPLMASNNDEDE